MSHNGDLASAISRLLPQSSNKVAEEVFSRSRLESRTPFLAVQYGKTNHVQSKRARVFEELHPHALALLHSPKLEAGAAPCNNVARPEP